MGFFFFNQTMKSASCLLLLVFFVALSYADFLGCAGSVSSQVNYKTSVPSLEVSWSGFANEERVIRYDLAVITEDSAPRGFSTFGCRDEAGFAGVPNVYGWKNTGSATSTSVVAPLSVGPRYMIVIRAAHASGAFTYANSFPFVLEERDIIVSQPIVARNVKAEEKEVRFENEIALTCPIDMANACHAGTISVRERLEEFYGPPRYGVVAGFIPGAGDNIDDDDDDDDFSNVSAGWVIPIAVLITAVCCIAALGFVIVGGAAGKDGGEFKTNVRRHVNEEEF